MGIDALGRLIKISPEIAEQHQLAVIDCLEVRAILLLNMETGSFLFYFGILSTVYCRDMGREIHSAYCHLMSVLVRIGCEISYGSCCQLISTRLLWNHVYPSLYLSRSWMCIMQDPDDTLKRKTFGLLYKMTKSSNVEVIVDRMIDYMISINDNHYKTYIASRCVELAEQFAPSNHWFIQVSMMLPIAF